MGYSNTFNTNGESDEFTMSANVPFMVSLEGAGPDDWLFVEAKSPTTGNYSPAGMIRNVMSKPVMQIFQGTDLRFTFRSFDGSDKTVVMELLF